jgi:predicted lactoylglutathione lyase
VQQISYVTFGVRDMPTLRTFYAGLGWHERAGSNDDFATYEAGGVLLALYPLGRLSEVATPVEPIPAATWNGVTLGVNLEGTGVVDDVYRSAVAAGALAIADPVEREWGGYSGYFADPEDHRWEVTWAPES